MKRSTFAKRSSKASGDAGADLRGRRIAAKVVGELCAVTDVIRDGRADEFSDVNEVIVGVSATQPVQHHLDGGNGRDGVDDALARVLGCRTVNGLKHRVVIANVGRTGHAHAALENGAEVC